MSDVRAVLRRFLEAFCASIVHRRLFPDHTASRYLDKKDSPGPRATPFRRAHLRRVLDVPFIVSEKSDGERRFLYVAPPLPSNGSSPGRRPAR